MTVTDLTAPEKPPGWQAKLAEMILEGSYLVSDPAWPGYVKLLQMHDKCNTTFQVRRSHCCARKAGAIEGWRLSPSEGEAGGEGLRVYMGGWGEGGRHFVCMELLQMHEQCNTHFQVRP
jgi:hypothetical protein